MEDKMKKMENDEISSVAGGWEGEYKYIENYNCPSCGKLNSIRYYCTSGKTTWRCEKCGNTFTIWF